MKVWQKLDIWKTLERDLDTATSGGVTECHNVDLNYRKGAAYARKGDELSLTVPNEPYNFTDAIAVGRDSTRNANVYAILTRSSNLNTVPINGVGVRGFKNIAGDDDMSGDTEAHNGWLFPSGLQPDSSETEGDLDISRAEVRFHGKEPKWFGIPKSVNEAGVDFPYVTGFGQTLNESVGSLFSISDPIGESNKLSAPLQDDFEIVFDPTTHRFGNSIEFGDVPFWGPPEGRNEGNQYLAGRFEYAYFAVSYLYDGYQESPLTLLPQTVELTGTGGHAQGCRSIFVNLKMRNIKPLENIRNSSLRVRKIRLYCAPSVNRLSDPLRSGTFYLANEIDVREFDSQTKTIRYSLPTVETVTGEDFPDAFGMTIQNIGFECDVDVGWADIGIDPGIERANIVEWTVFEDGCPWIRLGDNETYYRIVKVGMYRPNNGDTNDRILVFFAHENDNAILTTEAQNAGYKPTVHISHAFKIHGDDGDLTHRTYLGDELLGRPTYEQLSGLSQSEEEISPPRKGGYSGYDIPVIWNVQDKDGVWHPDRMMWAGYSPSTALTPDRFRELDFIDFGFDIVKCVRSGGYLAVLGKQDLVFGILTNDELAWDFSDSYKHLGCASKKSVCETPIGVFYLGLDGRVVLLSGNKPVDGFNSDAVTDYIEQFRGYWEYAFGVYSARHQQYILHFPMGGLPSNIKTVVYDFRKRGWLTASLWTGPDSGESGIMCGTTNFDGDALFAGVGNDEHGMFTYATDDDRRLGGYSRITIHSHFGNENNSKTIQRIKPLYTESEDLGLKITVTPEDLDNRPGDDLHGAIELDGFVSGKANTGRLALTDRSFEIKVEYFDALNAVFVEIEGREGVKESEQSS